MDNELRSLKLFEFDRALSYTSDILELRKKIIILTEECSLIDIEKNDWKTYMNIETFSQKDQEFIINIIKELSNEENQKKELIREFKSREFAYSKFVSAICKFMLTSCCYGKEEIRIRVEEINLKYIDELICLLEENMFDSSINVNFSTFFEDKIEFAKLIFDFYGMEKFDFIIKLIKYNRILEDDGYQD